MSETSKHVEPWRVAVDYVQVDVVDASNEQVCMTCDPPSNPAFARRIIACVNACAGLPTEALESGKLGEALKVCADVLWDIGQGETWDRVEDARKALRALGVYP